MIIIEIQVGKGRWEHEMPRDIAEGLCNMRLAATYRTQSLSSLIAQLPDDVRALVKSTKIEPPAPTRTFHGVWVDEVVSKEMARELMNV